MAGTQEDRKHDRERMSQRIEQCREQIRIGELLQALGVEYHEGQNKRILCIWPDHPERSPAMQVFEHDDSVYCFACCKSGGVLEIARKCASKNGREWSVEYAVQWLEETFNLTPPPPILTMSDKLGQRLAKFRETQEVKRATVSPIAPHVARQQIVDLIYALSKPYSPRARAAAGYVEDYIWAEEETPGLNHGEWVLWAQRLLRGHYAKTMASMHEAFSGPLSMENAPGNDIPMQEALE